MITVLVTGGTGLTGRAMQALAEARPEKFVFWGSADCDLTDRGATLKRVAALCPDAIINLAAISGGVGLSGRKPATLLRDNVLINFNILDAAVAGGCGKIVLSLSSGMFPPATPMPHAEDGVHQGPAHASNYAYAYAKRLIEPMIRAWREENGIKVVGLSPNGIIGEGDRFDDVDSNMTAALIKRFYELRDESGEIVVWGDGSPLRELSWAGDIARDFLWALDHYDEPGFLNVGTNEEISVREVARTIADVFGIDPARVVFDKSKPGGVPRKSTDCTRYQALSGANYMPVREAVARTARWYAAAREHDRPIRRGPRAGWAAADQ